MANVLNKTTSPADYRQSVHTPDFPSGSWFINPDISLVVSVPTKYWVVGTDPVQEMNAAQKQAVDDAEAAAVTANNRSEAINATTEVSGLGVETRALIELLNKRDNYLTNRIVEIQGELEAVKASTGNANNRLDNNLLDNHLATATRTKGDAITDYTDDINAGNQDT